MLSNKELGSYLRKIREDLDYSIYDVNKLCDISTSYISLMENGKRKPSPIILKKLSDIYYIDCDILYEKAGYDELINNTNNNNNPVNKLIKIPILKKISANQQILEEDNIEEYEFISSFQINKNYDYFYLKIQDDSMNLKFNNGDIILVQIQEDIENDEIGVFIIDENNTVVRKYKKENSLIILEPLSNNANYTLKIYNPKETNIKIIGKVIFYQGKI